MGDKKTNISVFATYWNEKDWIEASLAQIDAINPREIIICDGCFDPSRPNYSTDGTREIIKRWVSERENARMISALRLPKLRGLLYIFSRNVRLRFLPLRIVMFFYYLHTNVYRINQAATFNKMAQLSKGWEAGNWVMHIDADQFYPDEMTERFRDVCNNPKTDLELITATEKTFFESFYKYTTEYEKRNYNNMPYKVDENTLIVPTRDVITERYPKPRVYGKDYDIKKLDVGSYFHYKFRPFDKERDEASYQLGDRKRPTYSQYNFKKFEGSHPDVIKNLIR